MMKRRKFLKLLGLGVAALTIPIGFSKEEQSEISESKANTFIPKSDILDYEEGKFIPFENAEGNYTKVGKVVNVRIKSTFKDAEAAKITSLPFEPSQNFAMNEILINNTKMFYGSYFI